MADRDVTASSRRVAWGVGCQPELVGELEANPVSVLSLRRDRVDARLDGEPRCPRARR